MSNDCCIVIYIYELYTIRQFFISNTKYFKVRRSFLYKYDVEEKNFGVGRAK